MLVIALIVLAAMTLAAAAMVRTVDTSTLLARNISFKRDALNRNDLALEVVANSSGIQIHVREHGKPTNISRASAKLTLLADPERQQIELTPAGGALEATGSFQVSAGAKATVVLALPGRPVVSARFALK